MTAQDVLNVARSYLGYREKLTNGNLDDFNANAGGGIFTKFARDLDALGISCYSNTFGTDDQNNNLVGYISNSTFGKQCNNNTVESLGPNVNLNGFRAGDYVNQVVVPATQLSYLGFYEVQNYNPTVYSVGHGQATIIHTTGYNTKTAVSTVDGGQTWAAA